MAPFRRRYFQIIFLNENVRISIKILKNFKSKIIQSLTNRTTNTTESLKTDCVYVKGEYQTTV